MTAVSHPTTTTLAPLDLGVDRSSSNLAARVVVLRRDGRRDLTLIEAPSLAPAAAWTMLAHEARVRAGETGLLVSALSPAPDRATLLTRTNWATRRTSRFRSVLAARRWRLASDTDAVLPGAVQIGESALTYGQRWRGNNMALVGWIHVVATAFWRLGLLGDARFARLGWIGQAEDAFAAARIGQRVLDQLPTDSQVLVMANQLFAYVLSELVETGWTVGSSERIELLR